MNFGESSACDGKASSRINIIAVGDKGCGKSSLNITFAKKAFPENSDLSQTSLQELEAEIHLEDKSVPVLLWEFPIPPHLLKVNLSTFECMDAILLCFPSDHPESFRNLGPKWLKDIKDNCPHIPKVLVETKCDLKSSGALMEDLEAKQQEPITTLEILAFREKIRAYEYVECSSKTGEGVHDVYLAAVEAVIARQGLSRDPSLEFSF